MAPASCQRQRIGVMGGSLRYYALAVDLTVAQPGPMSLLRPLDQPDAADRRQARSAPRESSGPAITYPGCREPDTGRSLLPLRHHAVSSAPRQQDARVPADLGGCGTVSV